MGDGGWLSGGCGPDEPPPTVIVFEDRPGGQIEQDEHGTIYVPHPLSDTPWPDEQDEEPLPPEGPVIWLDTGSGPGVETRRDS